VFSAIGARLRQTRQSTERWSRSFPGCRIGSHGASAIVTNGIPSSEKSSVRGTTFGVPVVTSVVSPDAKR
jgi:hypothetical protein